MQTGMRKASWLTQLGGFVMTVLYWFMIKSIAFKCEVLSNRTISLNLPEEIEPGQHELLLVIDPERTTPTVRRQAGSAKGKLIILSEDEEHLADFEANMRCRGEGWTNNTVICPSQLAYA